MGRLFRIIWGWGGGAQRNNESPYKREANRPELEKEDVMTRAVWE